jgi:hypothetical protein
LAYSSGVVLAIRAFSGLLKRKLDTEDDLSRLGTLIEHMPSHGERALLWSELALCFYNKGRSDTCKEIVNRRIKPLLENISAKDISYRSDVIILLAPALYCAHKTIALEIISTLPPVPQPDRDEAYAQICRFVVTKHSPLDPFEWLPGQNFNISYEEMVDICDILHLIDDDWSISSIMEAIVCSIRSRHNNTRYSSQQKADITTRLQNIVNNDLPNKRHLPHEGFRIISQAQVNSIQQLPVSKWQDLIKEARDISNIADRALILCLIAAYMPPKYGALQQEILEEARTAIEHIPVDLEKIEHYDILANRTLDINPSLSRDALKSAWLLATQNDNLNVRTARRRIIDLAHRLDPNLANTFASSMDDDPARAEARLQLKQQLQVLDLKKKMIAPDQSNSGAVSDKSIYSSAAYVLLRSLNAGMIQHVPIENTREYIQIASTLPFSESFPIFAWVIQNAVVRYESTDQAKVILRGLYEAVTANIGLTRQVAARSSIHVEQSIRHVTGSLDRTSIVIHPGERDTAINYLQDWIGKNVQGYLKIADQFFGLDDLEVLKLVLFANPTCRVEILTSRKHQTQEKVPQPWEDSYQTHWRIRILDQDPPETDVVIVGIASTGESPVHDRWWLTDGGGLRIGTSFNSLGVGKASEISILSEGEAELRQNEVDQYLKRITREHNGERLSYVSFNL